MANVVRLRFPSSAFGCLDKLASHAKTGAITGVAFVCFMEDGGYIADTCGSATERPFEARQLLKALDAKIAKRQMRDRN